MIRRLRSNPFLWNSLILFSGTMLANVLNYLFHLVVGRMVSPEEYGEIESLISLVTIVSVPALALGLIATKYAAQMKAANNAAGTKTLLVTLNRKVFVFGTPLLAGALLLTPWIKDFLKIHSALPLFLVWLLMFLSFLGSVTTGTLNGWQRFGSVNRVGVWSAVAKLILGALLIKLGFGALGAVGAFFFSGVVGYAVALWCLRFAWNASDAARSEHAVEVDFESMRRFVLPTFLGVLSVTVLGNVDLIFAKHALSPVLSGQYSALSVVAKTIFFATGVISSVVFAMAAEGEADPKKHLRLLKQALWLTLLIGAGAVGFFFLFPAFSLGVFFGGKYASVAPWLGWFSVAATLASFANLVVQYLLSVRIIGAMKWFLIIAGVEVLALAFFGNDFFAILSAVLAAQGATVCLGLFFAFRQPVRS